MCAFASFVVTRDRVFWSRHTDGHTDIQQEHKLCEAGVRGANVVNIEIAPPAAGIGAPLEEWQFRVDQDMLPDWWNAADGEKRARVALAELSQALIVRGGVHEVKEGRLFAYGNSTVTACGSSTVRACDNSTVTAYDNSTVTACGSSTVRACGNSTVTACDNSTVRAYDNSTVTACDNSTVRACDNSTVRACGSSTVTACDNSTVTAYDNSTVTACDNSTTVRLATASKVSLTGACAVCVDRTGRSVRFAKGKGK